MSLTYGNSLSGRCYPMIRSKSLGDEDMLSRSNDCTLICPPLHPVCGANESPIGYLVRMAELNRYGSISWMCAKGQLPTLSELHLYPDLFAGAGWTGWGRESPSVSTEVCLVERSHRLGALRYCPACIEEASRWKAVWHLKVSVVCAEHGCWLRDSCPVCGGVIRFNARSTSLCRCGSDLSGSVPYLSLGAVRQQQNFIEQGAVTGSLIGAGHNLDLQTRSELILLFARFAGRNGGSKTGINTRVLQMDTASDVMTQTADALFGGSEGFTQFLYTSFSLGEPERGESLLRRFYKEFYRSFEGDCFEPYKQLLEQHLNERWPKALSRRNSLFKDRTIQAHPWLALQAACREFAVPKSHMRRAIAGDDVRSMSVQGPKRESVLVWRSDVIGLKVRLTDSLTARDAAKYLGVTKKQFGQLLQGGYFTHNRTPGMASGGVWGFSKEALSKFFKSLICSYSLPPEWIAMNKVFRRFGAGVKDPLIIIIEAIREGSLNAYAAGHESKIREVVFERHQFEDWYRARAVLELFSIAEAAKYMGIHQEFAYQLVHAGLLEALNSDKRLGQLINRQAINQFCSKYVLLRDLAREAGKSSSSVMRDLAFRGIRPVDIDWELPLRQKVYLLSDIPVSL